MLTCFIGTTRESMNNRLKELPKVIVVKGKEPVLDDEQQLWL